MKKIIIVVVLFLGLLSSKGCSKNPNDVIVGATSVPHAEILKEAIPLMKEKGFNLKIREFSDYAIINPALAEGSLDANFFQHQPFLDDYNANNNKNLKSIAAVHYEPLAMYSKNISNLNSLTNGSKIAITNDQTNRARSLLLLEAYDLITLKSGVGLNATVNDIATNPKNLQITEIAAAQIPISLADFDLGIINGNFALQSGLKISDALGMESAQSLAAETYANIVVVDSKNEQLEKIVALKEVMLSETIKNFIDSKYEGAVVSVV